MGGLVGLDYTAVKVVADINEIEITPYHWKLIRSLEAAFLEHYQKETEAAKNKG